MAEVGKLLKEDLGSKEQWNSKDLWRLKEAMRLWVLPISALMQGAMPNTLRVPVRFGAAVVSAVRCAALPPACPTTPIRTCRPVSMLAPPQDEWQQHGVALAGTSGAAEAGAGSGGAAGEHSDAGASASEDELLYDFSGDSGDGSSDEGSSDGEGMGLAHAMRLPLQRQALKRHRQPGEPPLRRRWH